MYPIKEEYFLPEYKRFAKAIKEGICNRLKEYSRFIKIKMRKEILNYYYSVENCFYPLLVSSGLIMITTRIPWHIAYVSSFLYVILCKREAVSLENSL